MEPHSPGQVEHDVRVAYGEGEVGGGSLLMQEVV
jgi:hypothetical protein